jgi:hypothetical protein
MVKTASERVTFSDSAMSRLQRQRYMNDYERQHQPNDADREPQIPCVLPWNPTRAFAVRNGRIKRLDIILYYTVLYLFYISLYYIPSNDDK